MRKFAPGKLDPALMAELLDGLGINDDRVVLRPAVGEDVCAIRMADGYLVAKSDPITFASERIGWYVVHVNANDLATAGAKPKWFLVTMLLPEGRTDEALVREIWTDLKAALKDTGCTLCGGHTEVTAGLDRPILAGQMLGEAAQGELVDKKRTRPGDRILLTKGIPIEGTAIIAREKGEKLSGAFSGEELDVARGFLDDPGISVLKESRIACATGGVHAMHDPTEGGVATGLWELARACRLGLSVREWDIPVLEPGGRFCRKLGLDPLGVIASGALLICVAPDAAEDVIAALSGEDIHCKDIGEMTDPAEGINLVRNDRTTHAMPVFAQDEITKLWS